MTKYSLQILALSKTYKGLLNLHVIERFIIISMTNYKAEDCVKNETNSEFVFYTKLEQLTISNET